MTFGLTQFSEAALVQRINSDLANDLGTCFPGSSHDPQVPRHRARGRTRDGFASTAWPRPRRPAHHRRVRPRHGSSSCTRRWLSSGRSSATNKAIDVCAPDAGPETTVKQLEVVMSSLPKGLRLISGLFFQ
jgi:hypothetical protein